VLGLPGGPLSPSRRLAWSLLGLPLILLVGLVALVKREAPPQDLESPPVEVQPATEPDSGAELGYARRELTPVASAPVDGSARAFLAQYHGANWPQVEARLEGAGVALDVPFKLHPWEQAEAEIAAGYRVGPEERGQILEQKLAWPAELTLDWVRAEFATGRPYPLDEQDLPVLSDLVADLNLELLGKAELYCDLLDATLRERFRSGQYQREPYTNAGLDTPGGFYATSVGALGWATGMVLTREDYPELAVLSDDMRALRHARRERVVRHLHAKIAR